MFSSKFDIIVENEMILNFILKKIVLKLLSFACHSIGLLLSSFRSNILITLAPMRTLANEVFFLAVPTIFFICVLHSV